MANLNWAQLSQLSDLLKSFEESESDLVVDNAVIRVDSDNETVCAFWDDGGDFVVTVE